MPRERDLCPPDRDAGWRTGERRRFAARTTLEEAIRLVRLGFWVFPCARADKVPVVRWKTLASNSEHQVRAWWDDEPEWNLAVACGPSGLMVLDLDGGEGIDSWLALVAEHGEPQTTMVRTGGGIHVWFRAAGQTNIRNSVRRIAAGVDVRAAGGYVVAPPSLHITGRRYTWLADPEHLIDLPSWLGQKLMENSDRNSRPSRGNGTTARGAAPVRSTIGTLVRAEYNIRTAATGTRNDTLFRNALAVGRHVVARRLDQSLARTRLVAAGVAVGLAETEAISTVGSAFRVAEKDSLL